MATNKDWLTRNHSFIYNKALLTLAFFADADNRNRIGFSPDTVLGQWFDTVYVPSYARFLTAYEAWEDPATRTVIHTHALNSAQAVFSTNYRKLYTGFIKNSPLVTTVDLEEMGFPCHQHSRTHAPLPSSTPYGWAHIVGLTAVDIYYRDGNSLKKAKPRGMHGVEMAWAILDKPPGTFDELVYRTFEIHPPFRLRFQLEERGKCLYFALRWENKLGKRGNWSDIQNTIIP